MTLLHANYYSAAQIRVRKRPVAALYREHEDTPRRGGGEQRQISQVLQTINCVLLGFNFCPLNSTRMQILEESFHRREEKSVIQK